MANLEHLKILKQGVDVWNKWREKEIDKRISKLNSRGWKPGINTFEFDFRGADLQATDLRQAELPFCDFSEAILKGSNFYDADLRSAKFSKADLTGVNFINSKLWLASLNSSILEGAIFVGEKVGSPRVKLSQTSFFNTDLQGVNLNFCKARSCSFENSNMKNANLRGSDLNSSSFRNTDLTGADLFGVDLTKVKLHGANLENALMAHTILVDVDLREVLNLEKVNHLTPSIIDVNTIFKSSGTLPLSFMRGVGFPQILIDYYHSLLENPINFYSCFISYSSTNQDFAEKLHADLQNKGVRCWFAPEDMKIGDKIRPAIDGAIRLRDKLLVILSETSVNSQWVETEVETAMEEERERGEPVLFPVRIDDAVMETKAPWARMLRRERNIGDFTGWKNHDSYQKAFDRLLRDLKA